MNYILALLLLPTILITSFLIVWGALDVYAMLRFRKNNGIDKTAIMGNWLNLKWMFASQTERLIKMFPWLSQDLSEVLGVKRDDGEVS